VLVAPGNGVEEQLLELIPLRFTLALRQAEHYEANSATQNLNGKIPVTGNRLLSNPSCDTVSDENDPAVAL
jgi:hypothetical protein